MTDATPEISFHTTLLLAGKTATGIEIPPELVERLGAAIAARSLRAATASSSA
jgi:hypothetical protein